MLVALVLFVLLTTVFAATLRIVGVVSSALVTRVIGSTPVTSAAAMVLPVVLVMFVAALVRVLAQLFVITALIALAWKLSAG